VRTFCATFLIRLSTCTRPCPAHFPVLNAIERTFEAYQKGEVEHGGVMVHYVVPEVDAGPVIAEAVVPIKPEDSLETFTARLHGVEHRLIVTAVLESR
jgi:folate-dependent phosphoribosylglycinamide formyltransferase PurN